MIVFTKNISIFSTIYDTDTAHVSIFKIWISEKQTQWAEMSKNRIEMCTGCSCLQMKLFKVCHLQSIIWYIPGYRGHSRSTTNTHIRDVVNPYDTRLFPMFSYSYNKNVNTSQQCQLSTLFAMELLLLNLKIWQLHHVIFGVIIHHQRAIMTPLYLILVKINTQKMKKTNVNRNGFVNSCNQENLLHIFFVFALMQPLVIGMSCRMKWSHFRHYWPLMKPPMIGWFPHAYQQWRLWYSVWS